jgi:hypothetical protein
MAHAKTYDKIAPIAEELRRTLPGEKAGEVLGVSVSQMRRIMAKAKRDAAMPPWTAGLDIRTANVLLAAGFTDKDQVREAIQRGRDIPWLKALRLEIVRRWLE